MSNNIDHAAPRYNAFLENLGGVGNFIVVKEVEEFSGAVGSNLVTDGKFEEWTGAVPDNWILNFTQDGTNSVTQIIPDSIRLNVDAGSKGIRQNQVLEEGKTYRFSFDINVSSGIIALATDWDTASQWVQFPSTTNGRYVIDILITTTPIRHGWISFGGGGCNATIGNYTIEEVLTEQVKKFRWLSVDQLKALLGI